MGCAAHSSALLMAALNAVSVMLIIICLAADNSLFTGSINDTTSKIGVTNECGLFKCTDAWESTFQPWALDSCDARKDFRKGTQALWIISGVYFAIAFLVHAMQALGCSSLAPSMRAMRFVHVLGVILGLAMASFVAVLYGHSFPEQKKLFLDVCQCPAALDGVKFGRFTYSLTLGYAPFFGGLVVIAEGIALFLTTRDLQGAGYSEI
eukprot:TRINITY_DN2368_c0_g2_i2.p2 TRINITY_DN2368_c0_g2~~TRINITY_DN2368_c0_g2_i2.p2  ORF type:complete len:236 (+),score=86.35 TRINITY_DN2368_c0_g2_i2:87-710(+)